MNSSLPNKLLIKTSIIVLVGIAFIGCSKDVASSSNPATTPVAITSNKNCYVASIARISNGSNKIDYAMTVNYDFVNRPVKITLFDSLRKVKEYEASFIYQSDAIKIGQLQSFKIDPTTQQIRNFITKADIADTKSDDYLYEYLYSDSGYLTSKNLYINGTRNPVYSTFYTYDNTNSLIGCKMVLASSNTIILESVITYETTKEVKGGLYSFPDGFESYLFSSIFNYGRKMKYPVKSMVTKLYDGAGHNLLDTWTSTYSAYTFSTEGYMTGGTQTGDLQQGFPLFYGKLSFTYNCW
jgi:hypothetical protein